MNLKEQEFAAKEKLEIVNVLGFAFQFARPPNPSHAPRGEDKIPFELFLEYTAMKTNPPAWVCFHDDES
ncbi:hypothetical protein HZA87_03985 [Candidatus Uhrbacteria bacterium]|nr:hypothetical protein [Candidatus Uhrbacteria bacterium]